MKGIPERYSFPCRLIFCFFVAFSALMKALWLYSLFLAYLNLRYMHVTMAASNGKDIETKAD